MHTTPHMFRVGHQSLTSVLTRFGVNGLKHAGAAFIHIPLKYIDYFDTDCLY